MRDILLRFRGIPTALVVLALSASLTLAAQAPAAGNGGAGSYEDNAGANESAGDEDKDENENETEATDADAGEGGDNCLTDPTTLTAEQLAAMSHGSIVCWAAHQDTPDGYANHGAWVSHWAHMGKDNASDEKAKNKSKGHAPSN